MPLVRETGANKRYAQNPMWPVRALIMVAFLDLFMQFPTIAPYARSLGALPGTTGIIVALYSITNLAGNLAAGLVLDRWGRRVPVLLGLLATGLALIGYSLSSTLTHLFVARAFHGMAASVLAPGAFAMVGDSAPPADRARAMGISGSLIAVAAIVGPLVAGVLRDLRGAEAVFLLGAVLMLGIFLLFLYFGKDVPSRAKEKPSDENSQTSLTGGSLRHLLVAYIAVLALTVSLGMLISHLPSAMSERGESATRTGLTFTAFAMAAMVIMLSPLSRLGDRQGRTIPIAAGLGTTATAMLLLWAVSDYVAILAGMAVFGLGFGTLFPAITALTSESVRQQYRGRAFGIFYAIFSLGVAVGSILGGLLG